MAVNVTTIEVNGGTAVVVLSEFTIPTYTNPTDVTQKAQWPSTVKVEWKWAGGTTTTWQFAKAGTTHITRLPSPYTNWAVCTISTKTGPSDAISGLVTGSGACTAVGKFTVDVEPVAA